jgi:hypothetical protein
VWIVGVAFGGGREGAPQSSAPGPPILRRSRHRWVRASTGTGCRSRRWPGSGSETHAGRRGRGRSRWPSHPTALAWSSRGAAAWPRSTPLPGASWSSTPGRTSARSPSCRTAGSRGSATAASRWAPDSTSGGVRTPNGRRSVSRRPASSSAPARRSCGSRRPEGRRAPSRSPTSTTAGRSASPGAPDGQVVVWHHGVPGGFRVPLDGGAVTPLPGLLGAAYRADGRFAAWFEDRVEVDGRRLPLRLDGPPRELALASEGDGVVVAAGLSLHVVEQGKRKCTVTLEVAPTSLAFGRSIWVGTQRGTTPLRVDPATCAVEEAGLPEAPTVMARFGNTLVVGGDSFLASWDHTTGAALGRAALDHVTAGALTTVGGALGVVDPAKARVTRVHELPTLKLRSAEAPDAPGLQSVLPLEYGMGWHPPDDPVAAASPRGDVAAGLELLTVHVGGETKVFDLGDQVHLDLTNPTHFDDRPVSSKWDPANVRARRPLAHDPGVRSGRPARGGARVPGARRLGRASGEEMARGPRSRARDHRRRPRTEQPRDRCGRVVGPRRGPRLADGVGSAGAAVAVQDPAATTAAATAGSRQPTVQRTAGRRARGGRAAAVADRPLRAPTGSRAAPRRSRCRGTDGSSQRPPTGKPRSGRSGRRRRCGGTTWVRGAPWRSRSRVTSSGCSDATGPSSSWW